MKVILSMGFWQAGQGGSRAEGVFPPTWDFAFLVLAGLILAFSFFLLQESIATVKFMLPDRPKPESGEGLCEGTSVAVIVIWCSWVLMAQGWLYPAENIWQERLQHVLASPREFAPGLLLASFLPTAVATSKLALIATARPAANDKTQSRPWLTPVVQGVLVLLNAAASVVTLYKAHG